MSVDKVKKYSIICGDIHKLITIKDGCDWSYHSWRIHESGDKYWVPVENTRRYIKEPKLRFKDGIYCNFVV